MWIFARPHQMLVDKDELFTVITMGKNTNLIDVIHAKFLIQFLPHASMAYLMMKLFSTLCLTNSLAANSGTFSIHFWSWKLRMEKRIPLR